MPNAHTHMQPPPTQDLLMLDTRWEIRTHWGPASYGDSREEEVPLSRNPLGPLIPECGKCFSSSRTRPVYGRRRDGRPARRLAYTEGYK